MPSATDIGGGPRLRYTRGAMILHWLIAAAILFQLAAGYLMAEDGLLPDGVRFPTFQIHKTVGLLILGLTLVRIVWRLLNPPPPHPEPLSRPEAWAAGLVHVGFYALLLVVPLSGWALVSVAKAGIPTFLFLSPALPWPHLPLPAAVGGVPSSDLFGDTHELLAYSFLVLLGLHVAGALKHAVVDRMPSFSRILPVGRALRPMRATRGGGLLGLLVLMLFLGGGLYVGRLGEAGAAAGTAAAPPAPAPAAGDWVIDYARSTLAFEADFSGQTLSGRIGAFSADIAFAPEALDAAHATIQIDARSITVEDAFLAPKVPTADGFDSAAFPSVDVVLTQFARDAGGPGYSATGTLTVKGKRVPVTVPFALSEANGETVATGAVAIDRTALDIGMTDDASGQWLGKTVTVRFTLHARPRRAAGAS